MVDNSSYQTTRTTDIETHNGHKLPDISVVTLVQ